MAEDRKIIFLITGQHLDTSVKVTFQTMLIHCSLIKLKFSLLFHGKPLMLAPYREVDAVPDQY